MTSRCTDTGLRASDREQGAKSMLGTSFVELVVAISIVSIALMVMLQQLSLSHQEEELGKKTIFAYEKALGMLAELQSSIERGLIDDVSDLDGFADDGVPNLILTTLSSASGLLAPEHPMSGNEQRQGQWRWARTITVEKIPGNEQMRYVRIKMQARDDDGILRTKASVGGVLNLAGEAEPSAKHYDVYVLAISSAPSLWLPIPAMRSLLRSASDRLSADNAGLEFRLHWISRLGYGRDDNYVPFVNRRQSADVAAPWVYWYPGRLAARNRAGVLFDPDLFTGRVSDESGVYNDYHLDENPVPHSIADQWNHCKRLPEARALFARRLAEGLETVDEPPLQLLLADMAADPDKFRNAIIVNLHGEGLPFPPMRNYSDAAKVPLRQPGVRVVTHPSKLWTPRDPDGDGNHSDTESLDLRVYAYKEDPNQGSSVLQEAITLEIMGVDLTGAVNGSLPSLEIRRLVGGIDTATGVSTGPGRSYSAFDEPVGLAPVRTGANPPMEMEYEVGFEATPYPRTWVRLYNTPLVAPPVGTSGLDASKQLYGLEYIPSPVSDTGDFDIDLASHSGLPIPRNTARWRIRIPKAVFLSSYAGATGGLINQDTLLTVTTRIGADVTTGRRWPTAHEPNNQSMTYAWWASSASAVPLTERYQVLGDPRHNPYLDLCQGGASFAHGYNWFFDDLQAAGADVRGDWACLDGGRLADGYGIGVSADVPRAMQIWREACTGSEVVFTNAAGAIGNVLLLGGEIALPRAGTSLEPSPVILDGSIFGMNGIVYYDSISPESSASGVAAPAPSGGESSGITLRGVSVVIERNGGSFWAKPWLGELAPDKSAFEYLADGNLLTAGSGDTYRRELRSRALLASMPQGTEFDYPSGAYLGSLGGGSLLQIGGVSTGFSHSPQAPGQLATLTSSGADFLNIAGMGAILGKSVRLPYGLNETLFGSMSQVGYPAIYPACSVQELEALATAVVGSGATLTSSGVLRLQDPAGLESFYSLLGETPETSVDHERLARRTLLFALRAFHIAGEPLWNNDVDQVPKLILVTPEIDKEYNKPIAIPIRWRAEFVRFDGLPFTDRYVSGTGEGEDRLCYQVIISRDGGLTWSDAITGTPGTAGERPASGLLLDAGIGDESLVITTDPLVYPEGDYLARVECYHRTRRIMSSSHQVRFRITR